MNAMQQSGNVIQIVEALRNTRDADTNLHGLNQLRRAVRGSDGVAFLQNYLSHAQSFDDLQKIWDAQLTVQNYHVTVTLLLALSDILSLASTTTQQHKHARHSQVQQAEQEAQWQAGGPASPQLQAAAAALSQVVLSRRMKALYFNLSSEIRGKANAALALLAALANQGAGTSGELARTFDFSLAALPTLARLPRPRKGEGGSGEGGGLQGRLWQQWRGGDVLKRPTRAAYVAFALGLLQHADPLTLSTLLATRPLTGGLLNHVAGDPPEVQLQVLGMLRSRVLSNRAGIPAATRAEVLSDSVLAQLSQLAAHAGEDGDVSVADADVEAQQAQQAADLAFRLLMEVAADPAHGLCEGGVAAGGSVTLLAAVVAQLSPGQRRLLRWLQLLRPAESSSHLDLIAACTAADPVLAVALLLSLPFSLEPSATGRCMAHAAVAGALIQQAAALPTGLLGMAQRAARPHGVESKAMLGLLRCAVPPCLSKAALSRGVQHSSALVRHATLCLLSHALGATSALLRDIAAAAAVAGAGAGAAGLAAAGRWQELGRAVQAAVRTVLPDPQPVLALYTALEKGGKKGGGCGRRGGTAAAASAGTGGGPEVGEEGHKGEGGGGRKEEEEETAGDRQEAKGLAGANQALVSAALRVLAGWQRALPGALEEANVDVEKLVPQDLLALEPHHQYLFMDLLLAQQQQQHPLSAASLDPSGGPCADASTRKEPAAPLPLPATLLLPVLRLLCGTAPAGVRSAAWRWVQGRLGASGVFGSSVQEGEGEAQVWLQVLPRGGDNPTAAAVCGFLSEALLQLQRRPHEFFELAQQQPQQSSAPAGAPAPQCSLLALCALRQVLRVLPSPKLPSADKAAIAAYVAAALGALLRQQHSVAPPLAPARAAGGQQGGVAQHFAHALLGVLHSEAQRGAQQGVGGGAAGEGRKRRKEEVTVCEGSPATCLALPPEGQCIASLVLLLEREVAGPSAGAVPGGAIDDQGAAHAKKKRRKSHGVDADSEAGAQVPSNCLAVTSDPAGDAAGALVNAELLRQLAQQGQHAQHTAWQLQHRLFCAPRAQAAAMLPALAAVAVGMDHAPHDSTHSSSGAAGVAARLVVAACMAHNLPLPHGGEERQGWGSLLDTSPASLLLTTLMKGCGAASSSGRSAWEGEGKGESVRCASADLIAAVQRRLGEAFGREEGGGEGEEGVVRQCLYWLERAANASQVLLLFQVLQSALSQQPALPAQQAAALELLCGHPLVLSALAWREGGASPVAAALVEPAEQEGTAAAAVEGAVAYSTVVLLRQQLEGARGSELRRKLAACARLLLMVSAAFHHDAVLVLAAAEVNEGKKAGKASKKGSRGAAAAAAGGSCLPMPPATHHWMCLLPWVPAMEVESAALVVLQGLDRLLAEPEGSWVVDAAVRTVDQLLSRHSMLEAGLLRSCCALLAGLFTRRQFRPVDACLAALLSGPCARPALAFLDSSDPQHPLNGSRAEGGGEAASEQLLQACLDHPFPTRSRIALSLVQHSAPAQGSFARRLAAALQREGGGGAQSALLACVLPAGIALLQQAAAAGAGRSPPSAAAGAAGSAAADVATCLRAPLLAFLAGKRPAGAGAAAISAHVDPDELAQLLHAHALPCLRICLQLHPLAPEEQERLLLRLLPPKGWPIEGASAGAVAGSAPVMTSAVPVLAAAEVAATSAERAQAAILLLSQLAQGSAGQRSDAEVLLRYLVTHAATLANLFKAPMPSPGQLQLEALLLCQLDDALGDAVAALPAQQRTTQAFARLAEAACGLGTSVLRHRFDDVAAMRTLRRFVAALLPDEQAGSSEAGEGQRGAGHDDGNGPSSKKGAPSSSTCTTTTSSSSSDGGKSSDSDASSESEGDGDSGRHHAKRAQHTGQAATTLCNPPVAAAALQLLQRLMSHSRFVPTLRALGASPPPLPASVHDLPCPLQSLLPLSELPPTSLAGPGPATIAASSSAVGSSTGGGLRLGGAQSAAVLKRELCELLETLMDLQEQYVGETGSQTAEVQQAEAALLPLLMAGYGASLSPTDRAVWSLAQAINLRLWQREGGTSAMDVDGDSDSDSEGSDEEGEGAEGEGDAAAALLSGPLCDTGFAWGAAATALQASAGAGAQSAALSGEESRNLLQAKLAVDPLRCAMTVVHFPEWRTLSGQGAGAPQDVPGTSAAPPPLPHSEAGYDPAFLLPFCVAALRRGLMPVRGLLQAGLLSFCLRALAAADDGLRGLAYEAVALFQEQLEGEEFREKRQLSVLLGALRSAIIAPFQRLPAVHALLCAEAALVALHPGTPMYPPLNKYLLRRAVMDFKEVPLFGQLMLGGSPQHAGERRWLLQLLLAGLRGAEDARLYRRRYVLELAMSLHDASVADPEAAQLALSLVCRATYVPRAARQLTLMSGLIPWLASAASRSLPALNPGHLPSPGLAAGRCRLPAADEEGAGAAASEEQPWLQAPQEALDALVRLTKLRAVARPGAREVLEDLSAAVQCLSALAAAVPPPHSPPAQQFSTQTAGLGPSSWMGEGQQAQGSVWTTLQQLAAAVRGLEDEGALNRRAGEARARGVAVARPQQ